MIAAGNPFTIYIGLPSRSFQQNPQIFPRRSRAAIQGELLFPLARSFAKGYDPAMSQER
jgi:hypothetical protein